MTIQFGKAFLVSKLPDKLDPLLAYYKEKRGEGPALAKYAERVAAAEKEDRSIVFAHKDEAGKTVQVVLTDGDAYELIKASEINDLKIMPAGNFFDQLEETRQILTPPLEKTRETYLAFLNAMKNLGYEKAKQNISY